MLWRSVNSPALDRSILPGGTRTGIPGEDTERWYWQGETISTMFAESTINQVVSRRFVKKEQMHWHYVGHTCSCKLGPRFSTTNWTQRFGDSTPCFESKRKRCDPRILAALLFSQGSECADAQNPRPTPTGATRIKITVPFLGEHNHAAIRGKR